MKTRACMLVLTLILGLPATADFADYEFVPPSKSVDASTVSEAVVAQWLALPRADHVFDSFSESGSAKKAGGSKPGFQVATEHVVNLPAEDLFSVAEKHPAQPVAVARVASRGAYALRLRVDLSGLAADDRLWQIDAASGHAFGPFTAADDSYWLPIVAGDATTLVLESEAPAASLVSVAHFYADPFATEDKGVNCPQSIACEEDATIQEISTGMGMIFIPVNGVGTFQCSGTLLNAPATAAHEPYFITAHHCFDGDVDVPGVEVIWDFRPASCGAPVPAIASLPRSRGAAILAENSCLDGEFIELDGVPVGTRGRAWLGWDSRTPALSDTATVIHHPAGTSLKISSGPVQALGVSSCFDIFCANQGIRQTQVQYALGITEQGSSGSGALYRNRSYRLFGMLSNGPVHNCNNPDGNFDNFASFYAFYPQVQPWLNPGGTPGVPVACLGEGEVSCPAKAAFGESPALLAGLRGMRDTALSATPAARAWVDAYYAAAPRIAEVIASSEGARGIFSATALPFAIVSHWLGDSRE